MGDKTYYLACEQGRPYKVYDSLEDAKIEVAGFAVQGYDFRIVEVKEVAWHYPPENGWRREPK